MIIRIFVVIAGLFGGVSASQVPEFVQQYSQRLGGAVDELTDFVQTFDRDASEHNLTRQQALQRYGKSQDAFLDRRGDRVVETVQRYERLTEHKQDLETAGPFARLYVFARNFDPEFVESTYKSYEPAVPVTAEGALHAGAGLLAGMLAARLLSGFFRMFRRRSRSKPA